MGCSVGGQLASDLLAHHPDDFRAAISLNGWYHMDELGGDDPQPMHYLNHPRSYKEAFGYTMYLGTSPLAPESLRRESTWIYSSGGPAAYKGDNEYFMYGHDLRKDGHLIDTAKTPLYALSGEYDPATDFPKSGAEAIAHHVPGSVFRVLRGLSHFMMSDDPLRFREEIIPILDEVLEASLPTLEKARR
jgi:pimeloyl-ACP methyl ester carboxylesterase